jgi:V8-like Glu-specific endopeptidase
MRRGTGYPRAAARSLRRVAWLAGLMAAALGAYVVTPLAQAAGSPAARTRLGGPVVFDGTAAVGALFTESDGKLGSHFCTASVVASPAEDLLITAAHCIYGKSLTPLGRVVFAPGYHNGRFPHGIWVVRDIYVDAAWAASQDPNDDIAFLVAGRAGTHIQHYTGAETLAVDQPPQIVDVIGYPNATSRPITCTARARNFDDRQEMVFDCDDYTNGTSGGPFLANVNPKTGAGQVIGVIGGYEEGGDTPDVSYSPRFFSNIEALYQTAVAATSGTAAGLTAPAPG